MLEKVIRRTPPYSKNFPSSSKDPRFYDFPAPKIGDPHLRSSAPKNEEPPPSSIFDLRHRRPKNLSRSTIFGPEECVEDRTEDGGSVRPLRKEGFFEDGINFFHLPAPKNEDPRVFHFSARRTGNSKPSSTFSARKGNTPRCILLRIPAPRPLANSSSKLP